MYLGKVLLWLSSVASQISVCSRIDFCISSWRNNDNIIFTVYSGATKWAAVEIINENQNRSVHIGWVNSSGIVQTVHSEFNSVFPQELFPPKWANVYFTISIPFEMISINTTYVIAYSVNYTEKTYDYGIISGLDFSIIDEQLEISKEHVKYGWQQNSKGVYVYNSFLDKIRHSNENNEQGEWYIMLYSILVGNHDAVRWMMMMLLFMIVPIM
jgi:hypothetical protein